MALCKEGGRPDTLVRIACQELEAWYLGEPSALSAAFGNEQLENLGSKARYRDPDVVVRPSEAIKALVPEFQKVSGARRMAVRLSREGNRSRSFQALIEGIDRLSTSLQASESERDN